MTVDEKINVLLQAYTLPELVGLCEEDNDRLVVQYLYELGVLDLDKFFYEDVE